MKIHTNPYRIRLLAILVTFVAFWRFVESKALISLSDFGLAELSPDTLKLAKVGFATITLWAIWTVIVRNDYGE